MNIHSEKIEYIDVKKVAEVTGVSVRTLRDRCKREVYTVRHTQAGGGRNGKKYEILISSLEPELQEKISNTFNIDSCIGSNRSNALAPVSLIQNQENFTKESFLFGGVPSNSKPNSFPALSFKNNIKSKAVLPDKSKRIALAKVDIVDLWQEFRENRKDKRTADCNFIKAYNSGIISSEIFEILGKISQKSLYRWQKILKDNGGEYLALINNYNYKGESQLSSSLSDFEKEAFIKIFFNDAKLNLGTAYEILKFNFEKRGLSVKSQATYRRFYAYIKRNYNDFNVLSREGEKALKDKVISYVRRDISDLIPGDALVADGNKLDFQVINPFTGKPTRAILVVFLDWASFDVAGYEIMLTENTQCILSALRNAILNLGKIPKHVYIDNGRAFRGSYFTGVKSFNETGFKGIYQNLGIKLNIARAYNGRAKVVERFFNDFVKSCPPLIESYIGSSISNKPAHVLRNEKFHKELHKEDKIPTIEQAKLIIKSWLNFYRSKKCPHCDMTINEYATKHKGNGVNPDLLDELMMSSVIRTARRNTIKLFNQEYETTALYGKTGKFVVKYSYFDISKIKIYSLKGEYIGEAKAVQSIKPFAKYSDNPSDLYHLKMELKKQKEQLKTSINRTKGLIGSKKPFESIGWMQINEIATETCSDNKLEITLYNDIHKVQKKKLII